MEPLLIVTYLHLYGTVWNLNTHILVDQDLELYGTHTEPVPMFGLELYRTHIEPVTTFDLEMYGTCMEPLYKQD